MKIPIQTVVALTLAAATAGHVRAAVRTQSRTLRVETPANNPALALENAQALYLYMTDDGRTLLYVEKQDGGGLAVLDVTTPANIRRIADATFAPASPFDFVQAVGDKAALIRYRDGSGYALLSLAHDRHPVVKTNAAIAQAVGFQSLGQTGLLAPIAETADHPADGAQTYNLLDTATNGAPHVLATVPDVTQQVASGETGTVFLLNQRGVTVIRRLRVEQDHEAELIREQGN